MATALSLLTILVVSATEGASPATSEDVASLRKFAKAAFNEDRFSEAERRFAKVFALQPDEESAYWAACAAARAGHKSAALTWLESAAVYDLDNSQSLEADTDLASLHAEPRFQQVLAQTRKRDPNLHAKLPELRDELIRRANLKSEAVDRDRRSGGGGPTAQLSLGAIVSRIRRDNVQWLKTVIAEHGLPGATLVGPRATRSVFELIAQASDDPAFEDRVLWLAVLAGHRGEVAAVDVARLTDRVRFNTGRPQLYGTLIREDPRGSGWVPEPIQDEDAVDVRRAAVGLPPLADVIAWYNAKMQRSSRRR
jgi:hypothetical protein